QRGIRSGFHQRSGDAKVGQTRDFNSVPTVYVSDARYDNDVGQPYILMEAMRGSRLWGGGATNYIPDNFKEKVYRQFVDFMLQLYSHPFHEIGMLYPDGDGKEYIGEIVDQ